MTTSTLTAEKSIREQLHELFVQMAQRSFDHALVDLNKVNFFDEVIRRVASGQDITADIPEAKQLSEVDVIAVVRLQRQQAANTAVSAWELSSALAGSFRTTARSVNVEGELIPHYDVEHLAETAEGQVRIGIKTWRRNIQVQVAGSDAAVNALNAQMAMAALQA
jgi:hypothetical protein